MARRLFGLALAVPACVVCVLVASALASSTGQPRGSVRSVVVAGHGINPELARDYAIFRRASMGHSELRRRLDTASTTSLSRWIPARLQGFYSLDVAEAQHVQDGQIDAWLVPGESGACIEVQGSFGALDGVVGHCESTADIAQYGLRTGLKWGSSSDQQEMVAIMVPDGNPNVTVSASGGTQLPVATVDNIAIAYIPTGGVTISFNSASGAPISSAMTFG